MAALDADIGIVADRLIEALRLAEALPAKASGARLKGEDVRFMAYALATFRTRRGGVLTEDHLRLLAAALEVRRPSLAAGEFVGLPRVKKIDAFLAAADRQGSEPSISEIGLAKAVGVEARTIRAWRLRDDFWRLVRSRNVLAGRLDDEDRAALAGWADAYARHRPEDGRLLGRRM